MHTRDGRPRPGRPPLQEDWERVILDRAPHVIASEGMAIPISRLIAATGAPVGTFYRLFKTKAELIARLVDEAHAAFLEDVDALAGGRGAALDELEARIVAMIEVGVQRPLARVYFADTQHLAVAQASIDRARERDRAALRALIERARADASIGVSDVELTVAVILGAFYAAVELGLSVDGAERVRDGSLGRDTAALVLDGLRVRSR